MKQIENKPVFVISKRETLTSEGVVIEKNDVGIIQTETVKGAVIFFIRGWKAVELDKSDFQVFDFKKTGDSFPKKNLQHLSQTTRYWNVCEKSKWNK